MKTKNLLFILLTTTSGSLFASEFGDPKLGEIKAPSCIFCHNPNGPVAQDGYPSLNGQDPLYLFNAMQAYKSDQRTGPMAELMKAKLQHLSPDDLKAVAAFYDSTGN